MDTPTVPEVVKAIEIAFAGVVRGEGITLHEADAIDDGLSEAECAVARLHDTDSHWQDLAPELIERSCSSLCFVNAEGYHYYIPAFMRWAIQHYKDSDSLTVDTTIYGLSYVGNGRTEVVNAALALFTDEQCRAIALFLKHMSSVEAEEYADAPFAREALERYWGQYAS